MTLASVEDSFVSSVLPVGMQNSALVLSDEDGNSISQELEKIRYGTEQSISPAAINIENSSDVIIGPVTHFNGPVTIYSANGVSQNNLQKNDLSIQSSDGKLVKSESTSSETSHSLEKSTKNFFNFRPKQLKYFIVAFLLLVIIVIVAILTILALKSEEKSEVPEPLPDKFGKNKTDIIIIDKPDGEKLKPAGPGEIIEKEDWLGRPALNNTRVLHHPIHFVIISHSATPVCKDFVACSARVRQMQDFHVGTFGSPDIGYNFIIGGDGNGYVGRGWDIRNFHADDSIGICFIGNYLYDQLTPDMISIAKKLLKIGVEEGKLAKDYKLIGHNQTYTTQSPGPNVYKIIKTWPHFDSNYYLTS